VDDVFVVLPVEKERRSNN